MNRVEKIKEETEKRKRLELSSPLEDWVESWFAKFGIYRESYEREYQVGKYLVDFAFVDKKIAVEVDGKQHDEVDQVIHDVDKDVFLENNGWRVYRIESRDCWNPKKMTWVIDLQKSLFVRPSAFARELLNIPTVNSRREEEEWFCPACNQYHIGQENKHGDVDNVNNKSDFYGSD